MDEKKTVKLDLTGCKYMMELHKRIQDTFDLPAYYGCNWSAFHDMLRGEIDAQYIEIYGEATLPEAWEEQLSIMHEILEYTKEERAQYGDVFDYAIIN